MATMTTIVTVSKTCPQLAEIEVSELDAMRAALLSYSQPLRHIERSRSNLPDGILLVIKCAAGDGATVERLAEELGTGAKTLQEAASIYLQRRLIGSKSTPFQQLGLAERASLEEIVLHKRWLLKWLHPDRNPNKWQSAMFNSVTMAANSATAIVASEQSGIERTVPVPIRAMSQSERSYHMGSSQRVSNRSQTRKRVRIINWRHLIGRVARRAVLVSLFLPLVYFGTVMLLGGRTDWAFNTFNFWSK
jgi:hypothetical protein